MKKNKKQLVILLAILVVCVFGYFTALLINDYQEKKASEAEAEKVIYVGDISEASSISFNNGSETMVFSLEDGLWYYQDDMDFPLTQSYLTNIAGALSGLTAVREIEIVDSLAAYGLETPSYTVSVTDKNGQSLDLLIGSAVGDNYYAMEPDGKVIYTIGSTLVGYLGYELYDMIELETFDLLEEANIASATITYGDTAITLEKETVETQKDVLTPDDAGGFTTETETTEEYVWYVVAGGERTAIEDIEATADLSAVDYLDGLLDALDSLDFDACENYKADGDEIAAFGLDTPSLVLTVTYTEIGDDGDSVSKNLTLAVGTAQEDGTSYYASMNDSSAVNRISADLITPIIAIVTALGK